MKVLVYVLMLSVGQFTNINQLVNDDNPTSGIEEKTDTKYQVPKITFSDEVNDESVAKAIELLHEAEKAEVDAVIFEWNTYGGSIDAGFLLSRAMEESPLKVICVVDKDAASMGMYLLQSCDVRYMTKRSSLMVHEAAIGTGRFYGHEVSWRNISDRLAAINRAMVEHIVRRMTVTPAEVLNKIRGGAQWWITWDEALKVHAVDYVVDSVRQITDSYRETLEPPATAIPQQ